MYSRIYISMLKSKPIRVKSNECIWLASTTLIKIVSSQSDLVSGMGFFKDTVWLGLTKC